MTDTEPNTTHTIDLPYEIDMLRAAYRLLPEYGPKDAHLNNLIIEGFWLHVRNLIEMFLGKRNATNPNAAADATYAPKDAAKLLSWYKLICNQISHLQDGRPVDDKQKLHARDPDFVNLIEAEIANFAAKLPPAIQLLCNSLPPPMVADLKVAGPSGGTNSPGFWGTGPANPGG